MDGGLEAEQNIVLGMGVTCATPPPSEDGGHQWTCSIRCGNGETYAVTILCRERATACLGGSNVPVPGCDVEVWTSNNYAAGILSTYCCPDD
jgi:hypothetical protein